MKVCKVATAAVLCRPPAYQGRTRSARAADIPGYPSDVTANDPREVAMLPKFCIHTRTFRDSVPGGNNPQEIKRLQAVLGPTYDALHHYCWGLMKTNRALFLAKDKQRQGVLPSRRE